MVVVLPDGSEHAGSLLTLSIELTDMQGSATLERCHAAMRGCSGRLAGD
jgi:hypothetical protein